MANRVRHERLTAKERSKIECQNNGSQRATVAMADKRKEERTKVKFKTIHKGKNQACTCAICGSRMPYPSNIHAESHGFKGGWREAVQKQAFILVGMTFEDMKEKFAEESRMLSGKATEKHLHAQSEYRMKKKRERAAC